MKASKRCCRYCGVSYREAPHKYICNCSGSEIDENTLDDWDPLNDPTTLKYFKKFDDLVDQTREYALEMLMCAQERELRRTVKSYLKPDISFELSDLDYSGENAIFTLKKEDNEAYLIIRIAPNVHVTDKEGF